MVREQRDRFDWQVMSGQQRYKPMPQLALHTQVLPSPAESMILRNCYAKPESPQVTSMSGDAWPHLATG